MSGDKKESSDDDSELEGLQEATGGWDPYLSELLQRGAGAQREERRRRPRDRTPARRRAILASDVEAAEGSDRSRSRS